MSHRKTFREGTRVRYVGLSGAEPRPGSAGGVAKAAPVGGEPEDRDDLAKRAELIGEILLCCKANNVPNREEIFLTLAFRTCDELRAIARELHVRVE